MERITLDITDSLNNADLAELTDAAKEDGRSLGKLLKEAALNLVRVRREKRALVSQPTEQAA